MQYFASLGDAADRHCSLWEFPCCSGIKFRKSHNLPRPPHTMFKPRSPTQHPLLNFRMILFLYLRFPRGVLESRRRRLWRSAYLSPRQATQVFRYPLAVDIATSWKRYRVWTCWWRIYMLLYVGPDISRAHLTRVSICQSSSIPGNDAPACGLYNRISPAGAF